MTHQIIFNRVMIHSLNYSEIFTVHVQLFVRFRGLHLYEDTSGSLSPPPIQNFVERLVVFVVRGKMALAYDTSQLKFF